MTPTHPRLVWNADGQPVSEAFGDVYFSRESGLAESRYVFLEHNQLRSRWLQLKAGEHFTLGETGFGTGLNFLAAWQLWRQSAPRGARLHFVSIEKYPLSRAQLAQALALWPELEALTQELIQHYPPQPAQGFHRLQFDAGRVQLTLIFGDVLEALDELAPITDASSAAQHRNPTWGGIPTQVDAWFLDGFAPAKNPQMWQPEVFKRIAQLSRTGSTFATFTAAAVAKQGLLRAGFEVNKGPGFGKKRHMLYGQFSQHDQHAEANPGRKGTHAPAWHLMVALPSQRPATALVVGAGLAGCHTAFALARRGIEVTLIDKTGVASGASGNRMGALYTKVSAYPQALTQFNFKALVYALQFYQETGAFSTCGEACGLVQLATTAKQAEDFRKFARSYEQEPQFVQWLPRDASAQVCGIHLTADALYFPTAGWLDPASLCRHLVAHPNIHLQTGTAVDQLNYHLEQWHATDASGATLATADVAIIANAKDAQYLSQTQELPLRGIRGQTSIATATEQSQRLRRVICGAGYIAPAQAGQHTLGASFDLKSESAAARPQDDQSNLAQIASCSPELREWTQVESGRVGFRCTSPDYLPLVGPVPVIEAFAERFAALRRSAKARVNDLGVYYPRLFVNLAHGSRGLAYTPLSAELVASMISGEPLPLRRSLTLHLHPARFLIRNLKRNRL